MISYVVWFASWGDIVPKILCVFLNGACYGQLISVLKLGGQAQAASNEFVVSRGLV